MIISLIAFVAGVAVGYTNIEKLDSTVTYAVEYYKKLRNLIPF